ncbi:hypothetical protein [Metallosphaera sp.]|uniref:ATPase domain-containing protein n=1 Tax=Metallosphaera sedula TaxID=43687 RepID=A0A0K1TA97_9CREN|nr:hypothetical protein MsedE_1844 [Metallosphaera sedula]MCP6729810.1 hypothetical protein [Metallosphaera sedula]
MLKFLLLGVEVLFDPSPKRDRKDFFDREGELERLKTLSSPIALTLGLRRTGKSSLIRIALGELGLPNSYLTLESFKRLTSRTGTSF